MCTQWHFGIYVLAYVTRSVLFHIIVYYTRTLVLGVCRRVHVTHVVLIIPLFCVCCSFRESDGVVYSKADGVPVMKSAMANKSE